MRRLSASPWNSCGSQIAAGASAVQLFDSWVGALSAQDYRANVLPYSRGSSPSSAEFDVPRIHFGVGTGELLGSISEAGADVVGVDWRVPLDQAARRVRPRTALRGTSTRRCCSPRGAWSRTHRRRLGPRRGRRRPRVQPRPRSASHHRPGSPRAAGGVRPHADRELRPRRSPVRARPKRPDGHGASPGLGQGRLDPVPGLRKAHG